MTVTVKCNFGGFLNDLLLNRRIKLTRLAPNQNPSKGDHLISPRLGGVYDHHGLYDGEYVIHYSGGSGAKQEGTIERVSLDAFCKDQYLLVCNHQEPPFSVEQRIRRAESRMGEKEYSVLSNNCEHFVSWCIYGVSKSKQVDDAINIANEFYKEYKEMQKSKIPSMNTKSSIGFASNKSSKFF